MREKIKDKGRLEHILNAIDGIMSDKELYTLENIKESTLLFHGFTKYVEIIGEAVYMLTKEFRESHQEVNWRQIECMRHVALCKCLHNRLLIQISCLTCCVNANRLYKMLVCYLHMGILEG